MFNKATLPMNPKEKKELAISEIVLITLGVIGLAVVMWLAWFKPTDKKAVNSYQMCTAAGNAVQDSYPSVCVTKDGQRFVNPKEKVMLPAAPANDQSAQTVPDQKYLTISEWNVKLPLGATITGAYYKFQPVEAGTKEQFVEVYDAGFDKLKNSNGVACGGNNAFQIYSISRAKTADVSGLTDPNSPTFHGAGAAYQKFSFTDEYEFGGLGAHQAAPPCAVLNPNSSEAVRLDPAIIQAENASEQAFATAFKALKPE